ncbi:hypothetical protein [Tissierella sp. Yu-01]|jgi:hypothetical protein|uniref:hypothetical protein n=1 Tax=Tissierella sp. Yu-01 TaxID=3035694 RepID=UPI00240D19F2|nr:hypothetical protein [Tissierella sp. Yu-01]WFA09581.1 hypothetical protein P3962_03235 [Tissierella sp. Yu-01]
MKMYKVENTNNYISFNKNDLRRVYLLQEIESDIYIELDKTGKPRKYKNFNLEEVEIKEEDLFSYLYLKHQDLEEEIFYNNNNEEYLHSIRIERKPYSVIRRAKDIDTLLEDEYLKEKIEDKIKENWNFIIEELDNKTIMKYFNSDKFQKEASNSISVDKFVKYDPLFNVNKLNTIIKDFDFSKEEDKSKAIEALDGEIKENLNNFKVDIDIKGIIKSNPDFFNLDKLIKGEEQVILKVFKEVELQKQGHTISLQAIKEQDITKEVIEELTKAIIVDDPVSENKQLTEEEIRKRNREKDIDIEKEEFVEKNNFSEILEL